MLSFLRFIGFDFDKLEQEQNNAFGTENPGDDQAKVGLIAELLEASNPLMNDFASELKQHPRTTLMLAKRFVAYSLQPHQTEIDAAMRLLQARDAKQAAADDKNDLKVEQSENRAAMNVLNDDYKLLRSVLEFQQQVSNVLKGESLGEIGSQTTSALSAKKF